MGADFCKQGQYAIGSWGYAGYRGRFLLPWTSEGGDALCHLDEVVVEVVAPQGSVVHVAVAADAETEFLVAAVFCDKDNGRFYDKIRSTVSIVAKTSSAKCLLLGEACSNSGLDILQTT